MLASRSAYFSAWRRCTRPDTAVAVPAMTAVRAIPRNNPGIVVSSSIGSGRGVGRVECVHDLLGGEAGRSHHLGTLTAGGRHERHRPGVLVDQRGADAAGPD